ETRAAPRIGGGEGGALRVAILGFDLMRSDLPLKSEFPVLVLNLLNWLKGGESESAARAWAPGDTVPLAGEGRPLEVTKPGGRTGALGGKEATVLFGETHDVGVYQVKSGGQTRRFAVNLFSEEESNIALKTVYSAAGAPGARASARGQLWVEKEVWPYIVLAIILLL